MKMPNCLKPANALSVASAPNAASFIVSTCYGPGGGCRANIAGIANHWFPPMTMRLFTRPQFQLPAIPKKRDAGPKVNNPSPGLQHPAPHPTRNQNEVKSVFPAIKQAMIPNSHETRNKKMMRLGTVLLTNRTVDRKKVQDSINVLISFISYFLPVSTLCPLKLFTSRKIS